MEAKKMHDKMVDDIASGKLSEIAGSHGERYFVDSSFARKYVEFEQRRYDNIPLFFALFFASAFSFWLLNKVLHKYYSNPKKTVKENRALINNAVSLIHSTAAACLIHYDFKVLSPMLNEDLAHYHSDATLFLVAFCGGYFFYDTLDIHASASGRALVELVCHHVIIIGNYTYVLYRREYVAFCAAFLFCETNSIFLHLRQLLLYNKVHKTTFIFRLNAIVNYATFTVYRLINCFWLLSYMFYNWAEMDYIVRFLMVASVPLISIVQLPLLYRIVHSDWFKTHAQHSKMNFD